MAHWLKRLLAAMAAVLLLVLWAGFAPSSREWWQNPYARTRNQLLNRQAEERTLLARKVRVDSLQPLLPPTPGLVIGWLPNLRADVAESLRATLAAELGDVPTLRARVGVFTVPHEFGDDTGRHTAPVEYYASAAGAKPSCLVVGADQPDSPADSTTPFDARLRLSEGGEPAGIVREDMLGPCLFWARYGAPGPRILTWLRGPGRRLASSNVAVIPVPRARRELSRRYAHSEWDPYGSLPFPACQVGYQAECRAMLLGNKARRPFAAGSGRLREPEGVLLADARHNRDADDNDYTYGAMLAAVEREFGRDRFARFWQSEADVEQAFAAAFGVELTPWAMHWLQGMYGKVPRGPRLALHHLLLTLLTLGALLGMAVGLGMRRQTGR